MVDYCDNCRFWRREGPISSDYGHCHRFPPFFPGRLTLHSDYPNETPPRAVAADVYTTASVHPRTFAFNWCGEHRAGVGQ